VKVWMLTLLLASIFLTLLCVSVALVQAGPSEYHYYTSYLAPAGMQGYDDCAHSEGFNHIQFLRTDLISASPAPSPSNQMYIGYSDSIVYGEGYTYVIPVSAPQWGPYSPSGGPWYGIWGNGGPNWETVNARVYVKWPGPWQ
jgi:hypothetical protein